MGDHDAPTSALRHGASLDGLGNRANLVHLEEEGVAKFLIDTSLHTLGVGHEQVVADDLDTVANLLGHLHVRGEIVLVEWILN